MSTLLKVTSGEAVAGRQQAGRQRAGKGQESMSDTDGGVTLHVPKKLGWPFVGLLGAAIISCTGTVIHYAGRTAQLEIAQQRASDRIEALQATVAQLSTEIAVLADRQQSMNRSVDTILSRISYGGSVTPWQQ